jgi:hypothetical protein
MFIDGKRFRAFIQPQKIYTGSISAPRTGHRVKQELFNRSYVTVKRYSLLIIRPCYSTPRTPFFKTTP